MAAPQRSRPSASLHAFGYLIAFWMSLTVISPFSRKSLSTTSSFSTLCWCRISRASSSVVPTGTVKSGAFVITSPIGRLHVGLEAQVAVGQDADQPPFLAAVLGDRHARDPVLLHQVQRFVDPVGRGERDRVDDHAALGPLDAVDLGRLLLDRQVLVDDAEAAELRHGDRQRRLGHRVHRRAEERHVQPDVAGQPRRDVDLRRQHRRVLRHQQDVVEGQGGGDAGLGGGERRERRSSAPL